MNKNESKYFNTAKKMDDALIFLLEKKDFEFITIKDVCKIAKVNRSTFYLHYENLNDLLDEIISQTNEDFHNAFMSIEKKDISEATKDDLMFIKDEYLIPYLKFIKEHKKVYQTAKNNASLFKTDNTQINIYKELVTKILDKFGIEEKYKEYLFDFFVYGIQSVINRWLKNDCDLEIPEVADLIKGLVIKDERIN